MGIRGVLFDAGNTLIRVAGSVGEVYAEVAWRHGIAVSGEDLDRRFRACFARRRRDFLGAVSRPHTPEKERSWWRGLVDEVFREAGRDPDTVEGFEAFFDDLYGTFERPEVWEVFADVWPCLDALRERGVPLGVVSNWDSRLHTVLRGLGLADRFRFTLTSAEFGAEKPHPSIFRAAADLLGLPPGQVLHVGDLVEDDLQGAEQAGLRSLLLDRKCRRGAQAGTRQICSLDGLPALVGGF